MNWNINLIIILFIIVTLSFFAFYNGLVIRQYTIKTTNISPNKPIKIVLITDLHSCIYGTEQSELIDKVKNLNADIILLAGDIADDVTPIDGTRLFLEGLVDEVPMYYVSGNHEYWSDQMDDIKSVLRDYGVIVLEDEYKEIEINNSKFIIAGVDDPEWVKYDDRPGSAEESIEVAFKNLEAKDGFKVLLAHRPEMIGIYKKYPFDLVVSGHAHGGQVRIPFIINGLYAPNQGWFPPYAGGEYKHGNLTHIVSRGLSYNPNLPRIFNPPEIVVINIEHAK